MEHVRLGEVGLFGKDLPLIPAGGQVGCHDELVHILGKQSPLTGYLGRFGYFASLIIVQIDAFILRGPGDVDERCFAEVERILARKSKRAVFRIGRTCV